MPSKKRGRPRRFKKKAFLEEIRSGCSRKDACKQLGISYKALEYHLRKDMHFLSTVRNTEREIAPEEGHKRLEEWAKEFHGLSADFLMHHNYDEIVANSKFYQEITTNFDSYLKHLAKRDPKGWGPVVRTIKQWSRWATPLEREIFRLEFITNPIAYRWVLLGAPEPSELNAFIRQIEDTPLELKVIVKQSLDWEREKKHNPEAIEPAELRIARESARKEFEKAVDEVFKNLPNMTSEEKANATLNEKLDAIIEMETNVILGKTKA